jgi:peptide/nickel transport system permease protein
MTSQPGDAAILHPEDLGGLVPPPPGSAAAKAIEGRSLGRIAWGRLRKDRVAMAGGIVAVLLVLVALFAPVIVHFFGYDPTRQFTGLVDPSLATPYGKFGGVGSEHLLGVEPNPALQRDVFSRIIYGARISLLVATLASMLSIALGLLFGLIAGFYGGWIDSVISRVMDVLLAFPILLFAIALGSVLAGVDNLFGLSGTGLRIGVIIFVIGFFGWPYMGRIVRGQVLSISEREFVDAARSLGASAPRLLFREILPNLLPSVLVYGTLLLPANILFEAGLSYLGAGIKPPTPSWGTMISDAAAAMTYDPTYLVLCGSAIFITVLTFNLLGDGLRDAFDPKGR